MTFALEMRKIMIPGDIEIEDDDFDTRWYLTLTNMISCDIDNEDTLLFSV